MTSTHPLAGALDRLAAAGRAAGADPATARAEGESLAATIAEAATGAFADWGAATGGGGAEEFMVAASRGRRWRVGPTPTLAALLDTDPAGARAYASALAEVCRAAASLGQPSARTAENARTAAAAQLSAIGASGDRSPGSSAEEASTAPLTPAVPVAPSEPPSEAMTDAVRGLWSQVMGELETVGARVREVSSSPEPPPRGLDLGPVDPWAPGRFTMDPQGPPSSPDPVPPGVPPTNGTAPTTPGNGIPATPDAETTATPPPELPPARPLAELLAELDALTGLRAVKAEIHRQVALLQVEAKRKEAGLKTPAITRHLVFVGNPGTGKTTVARLVGGIYRALGLLTKGQLIEVDRSELVAGYLGQTAIKTAEVVASAVGGVLFIDEAYALAGDQYGTEAIDTLVKEMEDRRDDLVVIVAGYPVPMAVFVAQNPGLASRFRTTIEFADYTDDELVSIFESLAAADDYDVDDAVRARFRELLTGTERGPSFGNGRFARNVLEAAIGAHAWRLRDVAAPDIQALRALTPEDLTPEEGTS